MADDLGPLFAAKPEYHLVAMLGLAACAVVAAIALSALIRGRVSRELGLAGLAVVPGFVLVLANLHVLDQSKSVRFCGSCHEPMAPIVASMIAANDSLASIHYQSGAAKSSDACYTCHSGYGLLGDFAAKRAGLTHMWHQLWGTYEYPLTLKRKFDIDSCLDCHRHAPKFRAVEAHSDKDLQAMLVSGEMTCTGTCHPSAHPAEALNGSGGKK
jgi:ferredoxin